ncbi:MAG: hypothetical protein CMJ31_11940 [Phycisphaerae bacterium]|nr:hypothetical protein [Phycisphaerae bacterium]
MLCAFSHYFPPFVERFLDQGRMLRRRFREETVTDVLMGGLITAGGGRLIVEFPDEPVTGADMEWNFVDIRTSTFFRLMLQAKQAYGDGSIWTRHCYRELLHTSGSGGKFQAEALCDTARLPRSATYPLYIFYHAAHTCEMARRSGNTLIAGINIADGFVIEKLVKAATTRTLRTSNKSLRVIAPKLAPLSTLFCPATIAPVSPFALAPGAASSPMYFGVSAGRRVLGIAMPPTPASVRARVLDLREAALSESANLAEQSGGALPDVPEVSERIPDDVQAVLNRREGAEPMPGLNRWRLTFVSASPASSDEE